MQLSLGKLFLIFMRVGAFTFGGGYAMIPIFERELVHRYKLLEPGEFYDTLVVCQSLPGAIAINFSVFLGLKLKGVKGAIVGFFGVILPSFMFILIISIFFFQFIEHPIIEAFFKGVRLSVVALMSLAGYKLLKSQRSFFGVFLIVITLALILGFNTHPFLVIVFAGLFGYLVYTVREVVHRDHS